MHYIFSEINLQEDKLRLYSDVHEQKNLGQLNSKLFLPRDNYVKGRPAGNRKKTCLFVLTAGPLSCLYIHLLQLSKQSLRTQNLPWIASSNPAQGSCVCAYCHNPHT